MIHWAVRICWSNLRQKTPQSSLTGFHNRPWKSNKTAHLLSRCSSCPKTLIIGFLFLHHYFKKITPSSVSPTCLISAEPSVERAEVPRVVWTNRLMSSPSRPDRCSRKLLFPFSNYVTPSGKSGTVLYLLRRFSAGQLNVSVDTGLFYDYKSARGILTYKIVSCQKGQTLQWQRRKQIKFLPCMILHVYYVY